MKEYTVYLKEIMDETSVDADDEAQAKRTAADLFLDFHPDLTREFVEAHMEIIETRELTAEEEKEIG